MAKFMDNQVKWEDFLDDKFEELETGLNLTNQVVEHLRSERVIGPVEYQKLISIPEDQKIERYLKFTGVLRNDVAAVKFEKLVRVLQIEDYRCLKAAKLFLRFAASIGLDTSNWIRKSLNIPECLSLFTAPSNMALEKIQTIGAFELSTATPTHYLQRPSDLKKIRLMFNNTNYNGNPTLPKLVIASGIGGTGKSTIARMFALDVINEVDNAIWIEATSVSKITSTLAKLGEIFGIRTGYSESNIIPLESFRTQLFNKLYQARTLIIMDNADHLSAEDLEQFLPSVMPEKQYRPLILVTIRPNTWDKFKSNVFNVDLIEDNIAVDYIRTQLGQFCPTQQEAQELVHFYGNLIIAIEGSIMHVLQTNKDLENENTEKEFHVSDLLKSVSLRQVRTHRQTVPGISKGVARKLKNWFKRVKPVSDLEITLEKEYKLLECLWELTFEKLQSSDLGKFALEILEICCCVIPDGIPIYLLECVFPERIREGELRGAIQKLRDFSLLSYFEYIDSENGHKLKFLKVHRVLQKVCWKKLGSVRCLMDKFETCARSLPPFQQVHDPLLVLAYDCLAYTVDLYAHEIDRFEIQHIDKSVIRMFIRNMLHGKNTHFSRFFGKFGISDEHSDAWAEILITTFKLNTVRECFNKSLLEFLWDESSAESPLELIGLIFDVSWQSLSSAESDLSFTPVYPAMAKILSSDTFLEHWFPILENNSAVVEELFKSEAVTNFLHSDLFRVLMSSEEVVRASKYIATKLLSEQTSEVELLNSMDERVPSDLKVKLDRMLNQLD